MENQETRMASACFWTRSIEEAVDFIAIAMKPFPSIPEKREVWVELLRGLSENKDVDHEMIESALDKCSCEGEWPGKIEIEVIQRYNLRQECTFGSTKALITPYTGDRFMVVEWVGNTWMPKQFSMLLDYTQRPSANHMNAVKNFIDQKKEAYGSLPKHGEPRPEINLIFSEKELEKS